MNAFVEKRYDIEVEKGKNGISYFGFHNFCSVGIFI